MSNKNEEDNIEIIYKINDKNIKKIDLFGFRFVKNNKDKCKIIYKDKEYELKESFDIDDINDNKNILSIKLKGINNITDMGSMFYNITTLISLPDIS